MIGDEFIREPGSVFEAKAELSQLGLLPNLAMRNVQTAQRKIDSEFFDDQVFGLRAFWALASLGHYRSITQYIAAIERYTSQNEFPEAQHAYFMSVAAMWRDLSAGMLDLDLAMSRFKHEDDTPHEAPAADANADTTYAFEVMPEEPEETGVICLEMIGDPLSTEGRQISHRFAPIIKTPLQKRGIMPASGALSEAILHLYPWADKAAEAIERSMDILRDSNSRKSFTKPLLFVGEPGTGKTSLAMTVASMLGRHCVRLPAAGTADSATLAATTRGWANFRPCLAAMSMLDSLSCDPCIIVDELDKSSPLHSSHGSVQGALMAMLDKPDAYFDTALLANIDLSHTLFMATANYLHTIDDALLDRFSVISVGRPREEHFDLILSNLRQRKAAELGVMAESVPQLDRDEYNALKSYFLSKRGSLRAINEAYEISLRSAYARERQTAALM